MLRLSPDAGVAGGMAVGAAGLQFVAQRSLGHEDVHGDGQQNGHQNTGVDLESRGTALSSPS